MGLPGRRQICRRPFPAKRRAQFYHILSHQIGTVKNGISFGKFVVERDGLALCR
jgi:hypothetical protein